MIVNKESKISFKELKLKKEIIKLEVLKTLINTFIPTEFARLNSRLNSISIRCRKVELCSLRHIFTKIAFDNNFGCKAIGIVIYNGDHSPSFNANRRANNHIKYDPEFKELYLKILKEYNGIRFNEYINTEQNIT